MAITEVPATESETAVRALRGQAEMTASAIIGRMRSLAETLTAEADRLAAALAEGELQSVNSSGVVQSRGSTLDSLCGTYMATCQAMGLVQNIADRAAEARA